MVLTMVYIDKIESAHKIINGEPAWILTETFFIASSDGYLPM
jgi:hypothetical protein